MTAVSLRVGVWLVRMVGVVAQRGLTSSKTGSQQPVSSSGIPTALPKQTTVGNDPSKKPFALRASGAYAQTVSPQLTIADLHAWGSHLLDEHGPASYFLQRGGTKGV